MTEQETFDIVVTNLRKQGCKSLSMSGECRYRTPEGLRCAAGWLIQDEDYMDDIEDTPVLSTSRKSNKITTLIQSYGHNVDLVRELQKVHDIYSVDSWEEHFALIATHYNLKYEEPT